MQAIIIAMTILGCDDAISQCNYVATVPKKWNTVSTCDAASEQQLKSYLNANYPTVIAVCEPAKVAGPSPLPTPAVKPAPSESVTQANGTDEAPGWPSRARGMLLEKPVHLISTSYAKAAHWIGQLADL